MQLRPDLSRLEEDLWLSGAYLEVKHGCRGPLIWTNSRWERLRVGLIGLFVSGSDNVWARYVSPGDLGQAFGSCNTGK